MKIISDVISFIMIGIVLLPIMCLIFLIVGIKDDMDY